MADEKARIEASLDGAGQVVAEGRKMATGLTSSASTIESKLGGALKSVTGALGGVVSGGLAAAGVFQAINLSKAVEDVKRLDTLTGQLAARTGASSTQLQSSFLKLEQRILQGSVAQGDFAKQLGGLTYDSKFAIEALDGIGAHALASGRDLGEDLPIGKALQNMGLDGQDAIGELDRVRAIAEQVGTVGGHLALQDSLGQLSGILQGVVTDSDQARGKLEGLLAVLGKGAKTPEQANQARSATLNVIRSEAMKIEYATGRRVLDDNNNLIDPTQSLKDLRALSKSRHRNDAEMRRSLINTYGAEAGLAIYRGGFDQVDQLAGASGTGKTQADADKAKGDAANQRRAKELQKEAAARDAGGLLLGVDSALTDLLGARGALAVETGAGLGGAAKVGGLLKGLLGGGAAAGGSAGATAGEAALLTGGAGAALPLAAALAALLPAVAVLGEVGKDRETMGREYRSEHAATIGAELARRAQERGGFDPADFDPAKGQGREAMVEMLKVLNERKDQLAPDFAAQVAAALAAELRRAPIQVKPAPKEPNQSGGN